MSHDNFLHLVSLRTRHSHARRLFGARSWRSRFNHCIFLSLHPPYHENANVNIRRTKVNDEHFLDHAEPLVRYSHRTRTMHVSIPHLLRTMPARRTRPPRVVTCATVICECFVPCFIHALVLTFFALNLGRRFLCGCLKVGASCVYHPECVHILLVI